MIALRGHFLVGSDDSRGRVSDIFFFTLRVGSLFFSGRRKSLNFWGDGR